MKKNLVVLALLVFFTLGVVAQDTSGEKKGCTKTEMKACKKDASCKKDKKAASCKKEAASCKEEVSKDKKECNSKAKKEKKGCCASKS